MNQETRNCQNCKNEFVIEPEDFKFYEKIKVPPPTWCPECRLLRRLMFRNELNLKRRKCDLCQKEIISMYGKDVSFPVYCRECWYSDKWEPLVYGRDYAFSKPFLPQYAELQKQVPRLGLVNTNNINSEWCNNAINNKNCYLSASIAECENVAYSIRNIINSKDCLDLIFSKDSELCYDLLYSEKLYKCFFATDCRSLVDSVLIESCRNCQNCFGCINLRNKSNYIFNEQYSREDYQARIKDFDFGSYENLERIKNLFSEKSLGHIRRSNTTEKSVNVIGDQIYNSKNCKYCFQTHDSEDSKFIFVGNNVKDSYDLIHAYTEGSIELCHEVQSMVDGMRITFSFACLYSHDIQYSDHCMSSQNIFGSISLRNKSYCILNKQYTKEEYEKLVPRIIEHMNQMPYIDKKGRIYKYGEFFPPELSPFAYNETIAQEYFPLTREEALEQGYSWKDPEPRNYHISMYTTPPPEGRGSPHEMRRQIPDHIKDATDDIVGQVIECQHQGKCNEQCTEAFKIIQPELDFLRKMNLPLSRLCPNCRHYQRIKQRNPLKLWHRKCQCAGEKSENGIYQNTADHIHHPKTEHCPNEFETSYAPERPEIVYCEQCYLREVV